jgi:CRP-like cAMP-binding protein
VAVSKAVSNTRLVAEVERFGQRIKPKADTILFREGDPPEDVFYLKAGVATLTMQAGGETILSMPVEAGSFLGLPAVMGDCPYSLTGCAAGNAEVYKLSKGEFESLLRNQPHFCFDVLATVAAEVRSARVLLAQFLAAEDQLSSLIKRRTSKSLLKVN